VPEALQPFMHGIKFLKYDEKKVKEWYAKLEDEEKKT